MDRLIWPCEIRGILVPDVGFVAFGLTGGDGGINVSLKTLLVVPAPQSGNIKRCAGIREAD